MNPRFLEMKELLAAGKFFKLVCGAGNEDAEEVRRLSVVYTLAGGTGFDVSAAPRIVEACVSGINTAFELGPKLDIKIPVRPFITVSVGMPGDHHVRKAQIVDAKCVACNMCIPVCPTEAISKELVVNCELCIGCGNCEVACPPKIAAISYEHNAKSLRETLPLCMKAGAENVELHAAVPDNETILAEWKVVSEVNPEHFISMCLDRLNLSNYHLIDRIKAAIDIAGERTIIQADGVPMSGGKDDLNTTLQAVSIADIVNKELKLSKKNSKYKNKFHILLSGGTNGKTAELARLCNVPYGGLSIGTHARKIVKEFIEAPDFDTNLESLAKAVAIARDLVHR